MIIRQTVQETSGHKLQRAIYQTERSYKERLSAEETTWKTTVLVCQEPLLIRRISVRMTLHYAEDTVSCVCVCSCVCVRVCVCVCVCVREINPHLSLMAGFLRSVISGMIFLNCMILLLETSTTSQCLSWKNTHIWNSQDHTASCSVKCWVLCCDGLVSCQWKSTQRVWIKQVFLICLKLNVRIMRSWWAEKLN